jgi:hypothetical protein
MWGVWGYPCCEGVVIVTNEPEYVPNIFIIGRDVIIYCLSSEDGHNGTCTLDSSIDLKKSGEISKPDPRNDNPSRTSFKKSEELLSPIHSFCSLIHPDYF